jgi:hypothetical protein
VMEAEAETIPQQQMKKACFERERGGEVSTSRRQEGRDREGREGETDGDGNSEGLRPLSAGSSAVAGEVGGVNGESSPVTLFGGGESGSVSFARRRQ